MLYDVQVVTSTGEVLADRPSFTYRDGVGVGDMLRARVWHAVHPGEQVHIEVRDAMSGDLVARFQLMPKWPADSPPAGGSTGGESAAPGSLTIE